jgi:signal transduction histidine kinase
MTNEWITRGPVVTGWLIAGVVVAVAALAATGYRATLEWQQSSRLLVERRAEQAATLLMNALTRDMRGVHMTMLATTRHWSEIPGGAPHELFDLVSMAFARYPYPESFFSWQHDDASQPVFFNRADRWPAWMAAPSGEERYPVVFVEGGDLALRLTSRIGRDIAARRSYSVFETVLSGDPYQVVARILYRDPLREHPEIVFGFTVNLNWVRHAYFTEIVTQVARIGDAEAGLRLTILDEDGRPVVDGAIPEGHSVKERPFPMLFIDPMLVMLDPPPDLRQRVWTVQVSGVDDPTLTTAASGMKWTVFVLGVAAVALTIGLTMTVRAVRAGVALATMRSDFVSTVTHDLKTPLATIRVVADTLVRGRVTSTDTVKDYANVLVHESRRLTRLVDNLLAYARVTDVADIYAFEPQAPADLVEEALHSFRQPLAEGGFNVDVDVPADLPAVRADRTAISLLLDNLLDNAIRYSRDKRWLGISARQTDGAVQIQVRDQGSGIPPDELARVQRRFFRGRLATRDRGSGLGLAIATRIAADHGGQLSLDSRLGEGTTVSVTLPIDDPGSRA